MSTARMPEPRNFEPQRILPPAPRLSKAVPRAVLRRGNREQGQALESIGHAVEYLVDSRIFLAGVSSRASEAEAIQILMLASRSVFAECAEVVPFSRRLTHWLNDWLSRAA